MPGMFLNSHQLFIIACEERARALAGAGEAPKTSATIITIILAAASLEAFINEFAEMLAQRRELGPTLSRALSACVDALAEVEKRRGSLNLKYLIASQTLSGSMFDKGANPYQDFDLFVKLRNDLVHLKAQDTSFLGSGPDTPQPLPKHIATLQQRGLVPEPRPKTTISWFNRVQTPEIADWACKTAHAMILAVLAMIPDDEYPARDPSLVFKQVFRG